jgi:hypothetical protein
MKIRSNGFTGLQDVHDLHVNPENHEILSTDFNRQPIIREFPVEHFRAFFSS